MWAVVTFFCAFVVIPT